jgi:hypothetical protein
MALHADRYPGLSPALLWGRLALQPLAIWWALAATTPANRGFSDARGET